MGMTLAQALKSVKRTLEKRGRKGGHARGSSITATHVKRANPGLHKEHAHSGHVLPHGIGKMPPAPVRHAPHRRPPAHGRNPSSVGEYYRLLVSGLQPGPAPKMQKPKAKLRKKVAVAKKVLRTKAVAAHKKAKKKSAKKR